MKIDLSVILAYFSKYTFEDFQILEISCYWQLTAISVYIDFILCHDLFVSVLICLYIYFRSLFCLFLCLFVDIT